MTKKKIIEAENQCLHIKMKNQYTKIFETPQLEETKKKLADMRAMKAPIPREKFTEHLVNYAKF